MKSIELKVSTNVTDDEGKVVKGPDGKPQKDSWTVPCTEFEPTDIQVVLTDEVKAKGITPEIVLNLVNTQYQTNAANTSRRERTTGAPKRIETEKMVAVLVSMGKTREEAETILAEARRA